MPFFSSLCLVFLFKSQHTLLPLIAALDDEGHGPIFFFFYFVCEKKFYRMNFQGSQSLKITV